MTVKEYIKLLEQMTPNKEVMLFDNCDFLVEADEPVEESDYIVIRAITNEEEEQICYKINEPCKYNCQGLCKDSF